MSYNTTRSAYRKADTPDRIANLRMAAAREVPIPIVHGRKIFGDAKTIMIRIHPAEYEALQDGRGRHADQIHSWYYAYMAALEQNGTQPTKGENQDEQ